MLFARPAAARLALAVPALLILPLLAACGQRAAEKPAPGADSNLAAQPEGSGKAKEKHAAEPGAKAAGAKRDKAGAKPAGGGAGGESWAADIPARVPHFASGRVRQPLARKESDAGVDWTLSYEAVNKKQVEAYLGELQKAGFTVERKEPKKGVLTVRGSAPEGKGRLDYSLKFVASGRATLKLHLVQAG